MTISGVLELLVIFWVIREAKAALFWLYVWQLKEYHIGRFFAHLRTARGKRSLLSKPVFIKLALLSVWLGMFFLQTIEFNSFKAARDADNVVLTGGFIIALSALIVYGLEAVKAVRDFLRHTLLLPVSTKKISVLGPLVLGVSVLFLYGLFVVVEFHPFWISSNPILFLLIYDLLTPVIVSAVVLGLQPFTVLARKKILGKARAKRAQFTNLKVIGITGSYGKTSTKEFLAHILSSKYEVLKTPEHTNSEVGVANTILQSLTAEHEVFVCEMGAYNKGGIKLLAEIVQPHIGVVAGINEQHLATFGSMENLLSAEGGEELSNALADGGLLFVNQNAKVKSRKYNAKCKIVYYGAAENVTAQKDTVRFRVDGVAFEIPAYGGHNAENLLGAIAVARELGMSIEEIAKAAATMPLEFSPLKVRKSESGAAVIDSTYSANPDGVIADLEYLSLYDGKKVIIMPCLIELGSAAKEVHRRIGQKIGEVCDLAIITTKECFDDVKAGAGEKAVCMESAEQILKKVEGVSAILLEGGKESRLQLQLLRVLYENE